MLLDTSAIVDIFRSPAGSPRFDKITSQLGNEEAYISIVQLAEIADWATKVGSSPEQRVSAALEIARIVPLDEKICLDAASIRHRRRRAGHQHFGLVDGIILATARSMSQHVLTLDDDFDGEGDCLVM